MRTLVGSGHRRRCKGGLVTYLGILAVIQHAGSNRGIDPHAALAAGEQHEIFIEAVRAGTRWTIFAQQVDVKIGGLLPLRRIQLWLPFFVKPTTAPGID